MGLRFASRPLLAGSFAVSLACSGSKDAGTQPLVDSGEELDAAIQDVGGDVSDTPVTPGTTSVAVTLVVEPDDGAAKILDGIKNATRSVHCEMYLFTDNAARDALIAAKKAGREVQVLLEKAPYPVTNANVTEYNALKAGGVDVRWTTGLFQLTHSKYCVIDAATAYVMTLNFTNAGFLANREYAAIDTDVDDVKQAEAVFAADFTGTAFKPVGGKLLLSPIDARVRLVGLLDGAATSIDVEMEELSDDDLENHFAAALGRGVAVRLVVPGSGLSSDTNATLLRLKGRGAQIKGLSSPAIHAKAIVVDGKRAYVGSINLTTASIDRNREVGLITETASVLDRLKATIDADYAKGSPF
jgi:cardiolipin synthase A/B